VAFNGAKARPEDNRHDRRRRLRPEVFDEGGDQPDRTEEVRGDRRLRGRQQAVRRRPVLDAHDPGHRHQDVEVRVGPEDVLRGGRDAVRIGGVDVDRSDPGVLSGDLLEQLGTPATDDDRVALLLQAQSESQADSAGRAGDEDRVSGDSHDSMVRTSPVARQRPLIQGSTIPGS